MIKLKNYIFIIVVCIIYIAIFWIVCNKNEDILDYYAPDFSEYHSNEDYGDLIYSENYEFIYHYDDINEEQIKNKIINMSVWNNNTFKEFLDDGGKIIFAKESFYDISNLKKGGDGYFTRGAFTYRYGTPVIYINLGDIECETNQQEVALVLSEGDVGIHELAHYVDYKNNYSSSKEFKKYYKEYSDKYVNRTAAKDYHKTNEKEFFAVLFNDIFRYSIDELNITEDLKCYMSNIIKETGDIDIDLY